MKPCVTGVIYFYKLRDGKVAEFWLLSDANFDYSDRLRLVPVRKHVESCESFVIQERWPDSRRVTDVDGEEPRALRPQQIAIPQ